MTILNNNKPHLNWETLLAIVVDKVQAQYFAYLQATLEY